MICPSCGNEKPAEDADLSETGQLICRECWNAQSLGQGQAVALESKEPNALSSGLGRLKGALVVVVGVVAFVGAGANAWRAYTIGSEATLVSGNVVSLEHHPRRRRAPAYTEALVTVTVDGRQHECSVNDDEVNIGGTIPLEVAFIDGRIECERQGSNWKNWSLSGGLCCCLGPLAVLIGFGMMFPEKRKRSS
jgi:hypothetical protein